MAKRRYPLPNSVELGYRTMQIVVVESGGLSDKHGHCDIERKKIVVDKSSHSDDVEAMDTILHEILHVVYKNGHLGKPDDDDEVEERVVSIMSNGVIELFRRNPKFLEWFYRHMKENLSGDSGS